MSFDTELSAALEAAADSAAPRLALRRALRVWAAGARRSGMARRGARRRHRSSGGRLHAARRRLGRPAVGDSFIGPLAERRLARFGERAACVLSS